MASVMLDNWEITDSLARKLELIEPNNHGYDFVEDDLNLCWQNILTSLILWDTVYICTDHRRTSCSYLKYVLNQLKLDVGNIDFISGVDFTFSRHFRESNDLLNDYFKELVLQTGSSLVIDEGFDYWLESITRGCNYLPHPRRARVIRKSFLHINDFSRTDYFDRLDENIRRYYDELCKLSNRQLKTVSFPLLYSYISSRAHTPKEEFFVALELRDNPDVKAFRESLDSIEAAYQRGNLTVIEASIKQTDEVCKAVARKIYSEPKSFDVSLGISPTINFPIQFGPKIKPVLHTTFLFDLVTFAIEGKCPHRFK